MGDADVRAAASVVLAVLREAGRGEDTLRRQQGVLTRFADFLAGRGLGTSGEDVCIDFIADQTGVRLGSLREPVEDRRARAVRRFLGYLDEAGADDLASLGVRDLSGFFVRQRGLRARPSRP